MNHQEYEVLNSRTLSEHPRMLFFLGSVSFLVGIVFGSDGGGMQVDWVFMLFPLVFAAIIGIRRIHHVFIILSITVGGYMLAQHAYESRINSIDILHSLVENQEKIGVTGTVTKRLYKTELTQTYRLYIDNFDTISTQPTPRDVSILLELPSNLSLSLGDSITLTGKLLPLYENGIRDFARYTFFQGVSAKMSATTYIRHNRDPTPKLSEAADWTERLMAQGFPRDTAGIILGMTIGNVELMGKGIQEAFRNSGISHILVVSGSNITFLIVLISGLLRYLPIQRNLRISIIIGFVLLYSSLVGWDVPVIRSTIMGLLGFYAIEHGARVSSLALLFLVACGFLLFSPLSLLYDPAFGLSFAATMSIILYYKKIVSLLQRYHTPLWIATITSITLSASIGTIPVSLYHFGGISYMMIFANIAIALVVGWILLFSVLYILLSFIGNWFLYYFGIIIYLPVKYLIIVAEYFGSYGTWEPGAYIESGILFVFFIVFYFEIFDLRQFPNLPDQKTHDPQ